MGGDFCKQDELNLDEPTFTFVHSSFVCSLITSSIIVCSLVIVRAHESFVHSSFGCYWVHTRKGYMDMVIHIERESAMEVPRELR